MPFAIQIVRCPKCNQPVYHAEEVAAAGLCKKMLESTTLAEHEGNLFCKQCYARKFGPKGVGFGGGAGTLGMDTGEHLGNKSGSEMTNKPSYAPPPGIGQHE
ncbi:unnamed protein product [Rotaria sp. Silwood2]|nr:unnamed protein product [Rotaria sp. Silwood2]CAF4094776.1 unnamed protein product [Rotaria sp. Silwood2]CAF4188632.1 unnamed protein product [Rotaria sp. Silwood2]CAF4447756.1 unnamed protein product [Rotaria sp. Silwood2]